MDRIQLDYTFILADSIGVAHGLDEEGLMALGARSMEALAAVQARRSTDLRWLDLPHQSEVLDEIHVPDPEVHGLTMHDGDLMFCCAETRRVCRVIR